MALRLIKLCWLPTFGCVVVLWLYSQSRKRDYLHDSFVRTWTEHPLVLEQEIEFDKPFKRLERSLTNDCLYLTQATDMSLVGEVCLQPGSHLLRVVEGVRYDSLVMASCLLYPNYTWVSRSGAIYQYNLAAKTLDTLGLVSLPVDKIISVGEKTVVLVGVDSQLRRFVMGVVSNGRVTWKADVLKNYKEGIFFVDGHLIFNSAESKILLVFYYHNSILAFDTLMQPDYSARTIDSISSFGMKIAQRDGGAFQTLASPRRVSNAHADSYGRHLVVQSRVIGAGESETEFHHSFVFDCYDLADGRYRISFSIPKAGTSTIRSFRLTTTHLVVLHADRLRVFTLPNALM